MYESCSDFMYVDKIDVSVRCLMQKNESMHRSDFLLNIEGLKETAAFLHLVIRREIERRGGRELHFNAQSFVKRQRGGRVGEGERERENCILTPSHS